MRQAPAKKRPASFSYSPPALPQGRARLRPAGIVPHGNKKVSINAMIKSALFGCLHKKSGAVNAGATPKSLLL